MAELQGANRTLGPALIGFAALDRECLGVWSTFAGWGGEIKLYPLKTAEG